MMRSHLLWIQDFNLPHECQHDLLEGKDDLKNSQTSLSVITKNLDCKYAHQVRNHKDSKVKISCNKESSYSTIMISMGSNNKLQ